MPRTTMPRMAEPVTDAGPNQLLSDSPGRREYRRRAVLVGGGAAVLACAACGSSTTPASSAPAPADPSAASSAAAGPGASPSRAARIALASVADIPAGSGLVVAGPDGQVLLAEVAGKVLAHKAVCTHQGAVLNGSGVCPLHGSRFDVTTGAVLNGPADQPLAAVAVTVSGGKVFQT
jgi:cytochrome b6-f complex iron-sulfur subunit